MSSHWRVTGRGHNTCLHCQAQVIWARKRARGREGGRAFIPFPVERCAPGTGDIALTIGLFFGKQAPLAEVVAIGTGYRSHADNCPALAPKTKPAAAPPASAPRAFSARSFATKKRSGGSR